MRRFLLALALVSCLHREPPPALPLETLGSGYYLFVAPYGRASQRALRWVRGLPCSLVVVVEDSLPMPGLWGPWVPDPEGKLAEDFGVDGFPAFVRVEGGETLRVFGFYPGYTEEKLTEVFPCLKSKRGP